MPWSLVASFKSSNNFTPEVVEDLLMDLEIISSDQEKAKFQYFFRGQSIAFDILHTLGDPLVLCLTNLVNVSNQLSWQPI